MAELTLHGHLVQTVFDLLGSQEDDITYGVGWASRRARRSRARVLAEVFGDAEQGEITAIRLLPPS
jgi:hypothetical protein